MQINLLPCLISKGQISSNGCISEKATGKLLSFCGGNLLLSNDTNLKAEIKKNIRM